MGVAYLLATLWLLLATWSSNSAPLAANARETGVVGGCEMSWMSPSTILLDGLTEGESRLAKKYSLHLYREREWDRGIEHGINGVPVLFIPGNAGSARQVRSIAAAAARHFYKTPERPRKALYDAGLRNLDFFTLDFNEDFSAFHGETLLEQAEFAKDAINYILTLYRQFPAEAGMPHPESVIVIAHSMGGIVARQMLLLPDLEFDAVQTLITLSTPHLLPPAPFDVRIEGIYNDINSAWANNQTFRNLSLVSVSGGDGDTMIPSDTVSLASLLPSTNALTLFTTAVPQLWSPVDHQAMVWCNQLRWRIVFALFDMMDTSQPSKCKPLEERQSILKARLLGTYNDILFPPSDDASKASVQLDVPVSGTYDALRLIAKERHIQPSACSDEEGGCQLLELETIQAIPPSHQGRATNTSEVPLWEMVLSGNHLRDAQYVRLEAMDRAHLLLHGFDKTAPQLLQWTLTGLASTPHVASLSSNLVSTFHLPRLDTSLAAYQFKLHAPECETKFAPMLRVSSLVTGEAHFFPDVEDVTFHIHESTPFLPSLGKGIQIDIYQDPQCHAQATEPSEFSLQLNWAKTLQYALQRYRLVLIPWSAAIVFAVHGYQIQNLNRTGVHLAFRKAFGSWIMTEALVWLVGVCLAAVLQVHALQREPGRSELYHFFLGSKELFFVPLTPLIFAICIMTVALLALGLEVILRMVALCLAPVARKMRPSRIRMETWASRLLPLAALLFFVLLFAPQQFAYLVFTLMTMFKAVQGREDSSLFSGLVLLLTGLPVNGSILVVWVRNLAARWNHPFASDHNIFHCVGVVLWYEIQSWQDRPHVDGATAPYQTDSLQGACCTGLSWLSRFFAVLLVLIGARHIYVTPALINIFLLASAGIEYLSQHVLASPHPLDPSTHTRPTDVPLSHTKSDHPE